MTHTPESVDIASVRIEWRRGNTLIGRLPGEWISFEEPWNQIEIEIKFYIHLQLHLHTSTWNIL
jgi:hypothetical protein